MKKFRLVPGVKVGDTGCRVVDDGVGGFRGIKHFVGRRLNLTTTTYTPFALSKN